MAQLVAGAGQLDTTDFWRRAQWYVKTHRSPDRSLFLAQSDSHALHVYQIKRDTFVLAGIYQSPTPILDTAWYQFPVNGVYGEWCFAVSARDVPIRLVNATKLKVRLY